MIFVISMELFQMEHDLRLNSNNWFNLTSFPEIVSNVC